MWSGWWENMTWPTKRQRRRQRQWQRQWQIHLENMYVQIQGKEYGGQPAQEKVMKEGHKSKESQLIFQSVMVHMVSPEQCWPPYPSPAGALRSNPWPASPVIIWSPIYLQTPSKSNLWDFWPLRHLIRVMRKHDLTNKKTTTKTNTKYKDNDKYI